MARVTTNNMNPAQRKAYERANKQRCKIAAGGIVGGALLTVYALAVTAACGTAQPAEAAPTEPTRIEAPVGVIDTMRPVQPTLRELPELAILPDPVEYIFRDGEGTPVDMEEMTSAWAAEAGFEKRYDLTDAERWTVASVVTAEAIGEPFAGKIAVAQCILQACEDDGIRPDEAVVKYKYAPTRPDPTDEALEAVAAVFDFGQVATKEPIKYFYAPARVYSAWHESQDFAIEINNHRFFAERKAK